MQAGTYCLSSLFIYLYMLCTICCPLRGHRGDTSHAVWSLLSSLSVYIQVVLCVVTVGTQAMQLVSIVQAVCCWSLRGHHAARAK